MSDSSACPPGLLRIPPLCFVHPEIDPLALLPFDLSKGLEGGRGERSALTCLVPVPGLFPLPQVPTSCQVVLTQHSLSLVLVSILSFCSGAVTPAVLSPALISVVSLHPAHTFANRPFIQLSLNFPVMSMPFVSYRDLN